MIRNRPTGPLFKWFGSKWNASAYYPKPSLEFIIEPFAGSASYSLRNSQDHQVILAESNPLVYQLWTWLIGEATSEMILEIPVGIKEFTDIREMGLSYGQSLLLKHWQRTNNVGNCWTISPWGNLPGQWTENTRSRVAHDLQFVKNWEIYPDYKDAPRHYRATWFIDPPYQYNYKYKSVPLDYSVLGENLRLLKGQVIVCEALDQKTGMRPTWLPFSDFRKTVTSRRRVGNNHHSTELIYVKDS